MSTRPGLTRWKQKLEKPGKVVIILLWKLIVSVLICSKLPYDVSNDQALEHQEVRDTIATMIKDLHDITERFLNLIMDSIHKIPYAMRYIAMQLRLALHAKFPEAPEEDILKVCLVSMLLTVSIGLTGSR